MSTNAVCEPNVSQTEEVRAIQVTPHADAWETEDAFHLAIEMPGVDESHADVVLEKDILTVTGEATLSHYEGLQALGGGYRPRKYRRAFRLPEGIDGQQLDASVRNGVLTLKMPKSTEALRRKITVRPA